jgi:hypothetical protein
LAPATRRRRERVDAAGNGFGTGGATFGDGGSGSGSNGRKVVGATSLDGGGPGDQAGRYGVATTSLGAPEVFAGSPGSLFSEMALASMAGRAIGGTVSPGARERIGATTRACPAPTPESPSGPMTGIAAEIREFTELLAKLGVLRDSGLLTEEEFSEQKQRLLGR